jgi:orotidine-5'-phosphate decarboxylase
MMASYLNTYADRAKNHVNPAARNLLEIIEKKRSNLCVSVDITSSKDFLSIIDAVGPYVSLIKASICRPTSTSTLTILRLDPHRYHRGL